MMSSNRYLLLIWLVFLVPGCAPEQVPRLSVHAEAPAVNPALQTSGGDRAEMAAIAQRLQAQIDQQLAAYQKGPRKKFIRGQIDHRYARYEEEWRRRIETVGNENYPAVARSTRSDLVLSVAIRADGSVESIEVNRSSGSHALDQAAVRIVELASPFAAFPPEIRTDTDILIITRTWFFGLPTGRLEQR